MKRLKMVLEFGACLSVVVANYGVTLAADPGKQCVPGFWFIVPPTCGICCQYSQSTQICTDPNGT